MDGPLIIIIIIIIITTITIIIKLMGGGREKYEKKYSGKGKLNEKIHTRQLTLKKYSCYGLKLKFIQGI